MNFIITLLIVIAIDRLVPISAWLFGLTSFKTGLPEILARYGLVSFPRTLLGAFVCVPDLLAFFVSIDRNTLDLLVILLYFVFGISAVIDGVNALRMGDYRKTFGR